MDHHLVDHLVPVRDVQAASALDIHAAHVSGGGDPDSECTDGLVRLMTHQPQVAEVYSPVDS